MELNEQEAHCIARLLQSALFGKDIFDGCDYCKVQCYKEGDHSRLMFTKIKKRLTDETGVDLSPIVGGGSLINSDFPYHKFLIKSNENAKEYFRKRLAWLSTIQ